MPEWLVQLFARYGYDVWAIDFEGYGRSSVTAGWSDIKSGVADLAAMVPVVERETGAQKYHMVGESSGALRCAAFAAEYPDRVNRLVFSSRSPDRATERPRTKTGRSS